MIIKDLFNKVPEYKGCDTKLYIKENGKLYSCEVYSDCGLDFCIEVFREQRKGLTDTLGSIYNVYCRNHVSKQTEIFITEEYCNLNLTDIEVKEECIIFKIQ